MANLHCPSCGKRIVIDSVDNFTVRWSTQKCRGCGADLSIRYDIEATFVKYTRNTKASAKKVPALA
jgi:hypothetical protein